MCAPRNALTFKDGAVPRGHRTRYKKEKEREKERERARNTERRSERNAPKQIYDFESNVCLV